MSAIKTLVLSAVFNTIQVCDANAFLRIQTHTVSGQVNQDNLERTLLEEIEGQVGSSAIRGRLARLESALHPMFQSLPKNEHGNLGHSTVRYALHRLFVQKHGWYIKGLDNAGGSWNESTHANILKEQAADFVQSVFEHRLGDRGLGLHDLAVVAATLEHLIHDEADDRLGIAYKVLQRRTDETITFDQASDVVNRYLKIFILGEDVGTTMADAQMVQIYPGWQDTKDFARDIIKDTVSRKGDVSSLDYATVLDAVEEVSEQYGRFQNGECKAMKRDLIALGDKGIGRVPLSDFYKPALDGTSWQFMESVEYLRSLGALDETNPSMPSVIVPNYVSSQSNCVVSTSYYSVCCIDECEGLMGHLEKEFANPDASPAEISSVVAGLSTSTVEAPRTLSAPLLQKLDQIAEGHHGTVPLHGRLFAQWMHHAFPRECPYPHVAGTTTPQTASEWIEQTGSARASKSEMQEYAAAAAAMPVADEAQELTQWTHEEELLVPRAAPKARGDATVWSMLRNVMLMASLVAVGVRAATTTGKASSAFYGDGKAGKLV